MRSTAATAAILVIAILGVYLKMIDHRARAQDRGRVAQTLAASAELNEALLAWFVEPTDGWLFVGELEPPRLLPFTAAEKYDEVREQRRQTQAARAARRAPQGRSLQQIDGEQFLVARGPEKARAWWVEPTISAIAAEYRVTIADLSLDGSGLAASIEPTMRSNHPTLWLRDLPLLGFLIGLAWILVEEVDSLSRRQAASRARQRDREQLLQRLSHQLRTPAAAIATLVSALGDHTPPAPANDEADRFLELLRQESDRVSDGIRQVMSAARGGLDRTPSIETIELASWARAVQERWFVALPDLALELDVEAPEVLVDPILLDEAVDALLDNAVKYGGPQVVLEVRTSGRWVEVAVKDSGPGVPPDERARVLSRLERIEGRWADPGGFGLGLWAASEVAAAHGGKLSIQDGARFVMRIPRRTV